MKYFSEKLNKPFDTEKECLMAEAEFDKEQKRLQEEINKAVADRKAKEEALNASKKELAKVIESAQSEVDEANSVYEAAREKAKSIINDAKKQADEILEAAKVKVREAEQKKYEAISAFNKKFGPYTVSLTGSQAAKEFDKALKGIGNFWSDLWRLF